MSLREKLKALVADWSAIDLSRVLIPLRVILFLALILGVFFPSKFLGLGTLIVGVAALLAQVQRSRRLTQIADRNQNIYLDSIPLMTWMADLRGNSTFANAATMAFTGKPTAHSTGQQWVKTIHPDDLQNCFDTYINAVNKRAPLHQVFRMKRFDGEYRWILNSGLPKFDPVTHQCVGYCGMMADVTEEKQSEERWKQIAENQGLFIQNSSFELKNPLVSLHGHLLQISRQISNQTSAPQFAPLIEELERAKIRSKKIAALVDQLVDFSDIDHLRADFDPQDNDLVQIIHEAQQLFSDEAKYENIPIHVETEGDLVGRFDSVLLTRVMWNLLSLMAENDNPRQIELSARIVEPGRVTIKILTRPDSQNVATTDESTKRVSRDILKIRMQIAERVVHSHAGELTWHRHDVLGTRIVIQLPLVAQSHQIAG